MGSLTDIIYIPPDAPNYLGETLHEVLEGRGLGGGRGEMCRARGAQALPSPQTPHHPPTTPRHTPHRRKLYHPRVLLLSLQPWPHRPARHGESSVLPPAAT